jgi:ribosome maturation factor RimP
MTESQLLYNDIAGLIAGIGVRLVDLTVSRQKNSAQVRAVVYSPSGTGINECARAHRLMQPRLAELLGTEDFQLEVASPGLDRIIHDQREYQIFTGRGVSLVLEDGSQEQGIIASSDSEALVLDKHGERRVLPMSTIRKAKLNYSQEGR